MADPGETQFGLTALHDIPRGEGGGGGQAHTVEPGTVSRTKVLQQEPPVVDIEVGMATGDFVIAGQGERAGRGATNHDLRGHDQARGFTPAGTVHEGQGERRTAGGGWRAPGGLWWGRDGLRLR